MTANAIPSSDPRDLFFNAQKLDEALTSFVQTYVDRLGRAHLTVQGATDSIRAYNPRGAWATATAYAAKDLVSSGGLWYLCLDAHTSGATFAGDQAAHWRLFQGLEQFATVVTGNGVADNSAALASAVALGLPIAVKGLLVIGTPTTITVPIVDSTAQLFTTSSQVTINNGLAVRPEWFGSTAGNIRRAVNALPSTGGIILLRNAVYPPNYDTFAGTGSDVSGVDYLAKPGVCIVGTPPAMASNRQSYIAGTGTIIQGPFAVFANGFSIVGGLGCDSSNAVVTALYGGTAKDGFLFAQPNKVSPTYVTGVNIQYVSGICKSGASAVHGVLIEGINGGVVQVAEGANAYHGVVCKSQAVNGSTWNGFGCGGEQVILKSESYAPMATVKVDKIGCFGAGTGSSSWGCLIQSLTAGARVQIGSIEAEQCSAGVQMSGTVAALSDIQIGKVITESCLSPLVYDGVVRSEVGSLIANNATNAVTVTAATTSKTNRIGSVKGTNITGDLFNLSGPLRVGAVGADTVGGYVYNYVTSSARMLLEGSEVLVSCPNYWSLTTTRVNSWIDFGSGNSAYSVRLANGCVNIKGLIKSGSAGVIANFSTQIRPPETERFPGIAYNGSVYAAAELLLGTNGDLACTNFAAGSTYVSLGRTSYSIPF